MTELTSDRIQEIARAAVNYMLMQERRYNERESYLRYPRLMIEAVAEDLQIPVEGVSSDEIIEAILDVEIPLKEAEERCRSLGIEIRRGSIFF